MEWLKRIPNILVLIYLIVTVALLILSFVLPRPEARGLLRTAFGILLFPSLVLLPLTLVFRAKWLALGMVPLVAAWIFLYGTLLLPRNTASAADAQSLTVLTHNLQTWSDNLDGLGEILRTANADVVALQEVSFSAADYLENNLADLYPYRALYPKENAFHGQGVMSKYPIESEEYWRNEQLPAALAHLHTEIDFDGRIIDFFSVHPMPPVSFTQGLTLQSHSREIQILLDRIGQEESPVVLAGDFNMTQVMDEYRLVSSQYTDTFREAGAAGLGFSFPAGQSIPLPPVIRLDYIFHDEHFRGLDAYPLQRSGESDHIPVWAELALLD